MACCQGINENYYGVRRGLAIDVLIAKDICGIKCGLNGKKEGSLGRFVFSNISRNSYRTLARYVVSKGLQF